MATRVTRQSRAETLHLAESQPTAASCSLTRFLSTQCPYHNVCCIDDFKRQFEGEISGRDQSSNLHR